MTHSITIDTVPGAGRSATHLVRCGPANWVILQDGDDLTLIDGGYPGNADDVEQSIARVGRSMGDVQGALLTHAHVDHLGGLAIVAERHGFSIHLDEAEAAHARGDVNEQISPVGVCRLLPRRGTLPWLATVIRLGALDHQHVTDPVTFSGDQPLDLPGAPKPVATHGHTGGHSSFLAAGGEILIAGDALITAHPTSSRGTGPQLLPDPFHHNVTAAHAALEHFSALDATVLLPGHGPIHRGSIAAAIAQL